MDFINEQHGVRLVLQRLQFVLARGQAIPDLLRQIAPGAVEDFERETGVRPRGPIRLLAHLRYFGYNFNPVSLYYVYDAAGQVMAISDGYDDHELVVFLAVPGADYLVRVVNFSDTPAFYDLSVATSVRSQVLVTSGPTGSPNPATPAAPSPAPTSTNASAVRLMPPGPTSSSPATG